MPQTEGAMKLGAFLRVKAAAELLRICASTLRNWDLAGKRKSYRHPMNRFPLYRRHELDANLRSVDGLLKKKTGASLQRKHYGNIGQGSEPVPIFSRLFQEERQDD